MAVCRERLEADADENPAASDYYIAVEQAFLLTGMLSELYPQTRIQICRNYYVADR